MCLRIGHRFKNIDCEDDPDEINPHDKRRIHLSFYDCAHNIIIAALIWNEEDDFNKAVVAVMVHPTNLASLDLEMFAQEILQTKNERIINILKQIVEELKDPLLDQTS